MKSIFKLNPALTLAFFVSVQVVLSQSVDIEGNIVDTDGVIGHVHIQNTTSKTYAISDSLGRFSIAVKQKDTLFFSTITHQTKKLIIDFENIEDIKEMQVELHKLIYELDEVNIFRINTERVLRNNIGQKNSSENQTISLSGAPRNTLLHLDKTVSGLSVNLEAIYHRLSGQRKKAKLKKKWETQDLAIEMLRKNYSFDFISEAFFVPKSRVYEFLLFAMDRTPLKTAVYSRNKYLMLKYLEESSVDFNQD